MATLPGVRTTILDRFYNLARTDLPGGPLIAVIAKRSTATVTASPDFIPYYAISEQDVITQFGDGSPLHRAYYETTTGGATGIALIPLPANAVFNQTLGTVTSTSYAGLDCFNEAFAACESARADIIVPWGRGSNTYDWDDVATPVATPGGNTEYGFYADNAASASSWLKKVADKCADITANSYPVTAVLGIKPIVGGENPTPSEIAAATTFTNLIGRDTMDNGSLVSVVATENRPLSAPSSWGWSNGACLYAALIARLNAWSATTGKPMYNIDRVRWNPTRTQAENMIGLGLVPAQLDFQGSPRWVDGTTFAKSSSDFIRLTTVRIVFDAVKLIRKVSQNYIGEGMSITNRNAFETQIASSLRNMQQVGAINHADFRVQYAPSTNRAYIDLAIVPAFELREVIVTVSVNF